MQATIIEDHTLTPRQPNGKNPSKTAIPFFQLLDEYDFPQPKQGDILQGEILRIDKDVLFVDVGSKRDAMVPYDEVMELDSALLDSLSRGDEVPVYVMRTPVGDDRLVVSLERGMQQKDWERAKALEEEGETVTLKIINHNKGGLVVEFGNIQGFVPNSHIPEIRNNRNQDERHQFKASQIGDTRPLKIIETDPKQDRLVLSATAAQQEQRLERLKKLSEGDVVTGEVVSLKKYGAFVNIGDGLTGLLHISKISWDYISHPSERLAVGDEIEVMIEDIELERERISLNRRALLPGPWQKFAESHETGDLAAGEVTNIVDFGAFVKLPEGVEGLLHQNEINTGPGGSAADVLEPGDVILARIIQIDVERQQFKLSMRRVSAAEEVAWMSAQV